MARTLIARLACSVAVTSITLSSVASFAQSVPCPEVRLDAGLACADFALGIGIFPPDKHVQRDVLNKAGNIVRQFSARTGEYAGVFKVD